jgi:HEPN domain-containing protein
MSRVYESEQEAEKQVKKLASRDSERHYVIHHIRLFPEFKSEPVDKLKKELIEGITYLHSLFVDEEYNYPYHLQYQTQTLINSIGEPQVDEVKAEFYENRKD